MLQNYEMPFPKNEFKSSWKERDNHDLKKRNLPGLNTPFPKKWNFVFPKKKKSSVRFSRHVNLDVKLKQPVFIKKKGVFCAILPNFANFRTFFFPEIPQISPNFRDPKILDSVLKHRKKGVFWQGGKIPKFPEFPEISRNCKFAQISGKFGENFPKIVFPGCTDVCTCEKKCKFGEISGKFRQILDIFCKFVSPEIPKIRRKFPRFSRNFNFSTTRYRAVF